MVEKYLLVIAVLGAMAGLNLGMVASHVQASYDPGRGDCGQRGYSWEFCGYTQPAGQGQAKLTQVNWGSADGNLNNPSCEHHCYSGGSSGGGSDDNSYAQQPKVTQTAYFRDNCFWSFPVQCHSESSTTNINLHLRTL